MNSEHVEVLRRMRNEWPLATDEGPALDAAIAALSAPQSGDWVLVPKDAIERAIETLENDGDEHGEGRNLRAMLDAAQQPPAEAVELTVCCGREECGGECGNEWRGMEWVRKDMLPPAEAQPVGSVVWSAGIENTIIEVEWSAGVEPPVGTKLYAAPPPSAPVGVECLSCCGGNDETPKSHCMDCSRYPGQLTQQPAAVDGALVRELRGHEVERLLIKYAAQHDKTSPRMAQMMELGARAAAALAQQPAAVDGVRGLVAKWREEATAYVVRANEKDKSGGFRWAGWMRDELRSKAGVCKRHADELESALTAQQGGES